MSCLWCLSLQFAFISVILILSLPLLWFLPSAFFRAIHTYAKIGFFQEAGEKSTSDWKLFLFWKSWIETHVPVTECAINTTCLEHARLALCVQTNCIACAQCTDVSQKQQTRCAYAAKLICTCAVNMSGNFGRPSWGHKLLQFPDRENFSAEKGGQVWGNPDVFWL